jgi:hypothetical protein
MKKAPACAGAVRISGSRGRQDRFIIPPPADAAEHEAVQHYIPLFVREQFDAPMPELYVSHFAGMTEGEIDAEVNTTLAARPDLFRRVDVYGNDDPSGDHWCVRLESYDQATFRKHKH